MKTIHIECKQIMEWDEKTREKIIEKYRHINVDHDWWDFVYESWEEKLSSYGFDIVDTEMVDQKKYDSETGKFKFTGIKVPRKVYNISFSGFYSQGDGASYTGRVDIEKWLEYRNEPKYRRILALLKSGSIECTGEIRRDRSHHYVHWNTTSLYLDFRYNAKGNTNNIDNLLNEIEEECFRHHQELNRELYSDLEQEYDHLTSDEQVRDTLEANEYEFDNEGNMH